MCHTGSHWAFFLWLDKVRGRRRHRGVIESSYMFLCHRERGQRVRSQHRTQCSCSMCASEASADPDGASIHASAGHIHKAHSQDTRSFPALPYQSDYYCTCIRHAINKGLHTHLGHIPEHTSQRSTSMEDHVRARARCSPVLAPVLMSARLRACGARACCARA